jgi:hypothetical protein
LMVEIATLAVLSLTALIHTNSVAAEYGRKSIAEWNDPFTPPETRTRCIADARGDWPWGGEWSFCKEWATDTKWMVVEIFTKTIGPDASSVVARDAIEAVAQACGQKAAAVAVVALLSTPSPEVGARLAVAWPLAVAAFNACLADESARLVAVSVATTALKLSFEPTSHWSRWSNEKGDTPTPPTPPPAEQGKEHPPGTIVYKNGSYKEPGDPRIYIAH